MAKKKTPARRVPRTSTPRMYGNGKPAQGAAQEPRTSAPAPSAPAGAGARAAAAQPGRSVPAAMRVPVTATQDYSYVLKDLRRLGILAVATFAVLVALGLIVR